MAKKSTAKSGAAPSDIAPKEEAVSAVEAVTGVTMPEPAPEPALEPAAAAEPAPMDKPAPAPEVAEVAAPAPIDGMASEIKEGGPAASELAMQQGAAIGQDSASKTADRSAAGKLAAEKRLATVADTIRHDGETYGADELIWLTQRQFNALLPTGALVEAAWDDLEIDLDFLNS